jgi:hypothetical protein
MSPTGTKISLLIVLLFGFVPARAQTQAQTQQTPSVEQAKETEKIKEGNDLIQSLRQQREEAQDKLTNAYVVIMKLQRELDKMKADQKEQKESDANHPTAPPPK